MYQLVTLSFGTWLLLSICVVSLTPPIPIRSYQGTFQGVTRNNKDTLWNPAFYSYHYQRIANDWDANIILPFRDTVFITDTLPTDDRTYPTIGNGHVATVVYSDTIAMNGFYNGYAYESHRARIPSAAGVRIGSLPEKNVVNQYVLDVGHGLFTRVIVGKHFRLVQSMYAHRALKEVIAVEIKLMRTSGSREPLTVGLDLKFTSSKDLTGQYIKSGLPGLPNVTYFRGYSNSPEEYDAFRSSIHFLYSNVPSYLTLPVHQTHKKWYLLTSVGRTRKKVFAAFYRAKQMAAQGILLKNHAKAWTELWKKGNIDIRGNLKLSQVTYAAQYYLLSSLPYKADLEWPGFVGLSPGGLAHGLTEDDYGGHVFWDQDTWMFPSVLMLHSDIGRILMESRTRTLDAAKARATMNGYQGAMYPWETAHTGMETTNAIMVAIYELHVTGDIAYAAQQYLYMTQDINFFQNERGAEMVESIADFWVSRSVYDIKLHKYVIRNVMGPDEYHYPVNNSIYTNVIAIKSLRLAEYCLRMIGKNSSKTHMYKTVADNMYLPFDSKLQYHPEYDGYREGIRVKQADVILLGFPLMLDMPKSVRYNDLVRYGMVSDVNGPAMTWAMFAIGWLEMKNRTKANHYFEKNFNNVLGPFKLWTEYSNGKGAVNFITGMGGFLQGLIFGYGGFRIYNDHLDFDPTLPLNSTQMTLTDLDYLGNSFTLIFNNIYMSLILTKQGNLTLSVKLYRMGKIVPLVLKKTLRFRTQRAAIIVTNPTRYKRSTTKK